MKHKDTGIELNKYKVLWASIVHRDIGKKPVNFKGNSNNNGLQTVMAVLIFIQGLWMTHSTSPANI